MSPSLSAESLEKITARLRQAMAGSAEVFPGETGMRQPVHVVYGGAHLFKADAALKLGQIAVKTFKTYAPDAETLAAALGMSSELAETVYNKVSEKLRSEAVEDLRIDFEDGYGIRPDAEEDGHAASAAEATAKGMEAGILPPFIGIRIKPLTEESMARSIRTLDIFLTTLVAASGGKLPENFVVNLPKVVVPEQVTALVGIFEEIEQKLRLATGVLKMEMMIETTQSIVSANGEMAMPRLLEAANGLCKAAHFGAYDYTASCNITAAHQDLLHPACDFARNMMQIAFGGTGVWLSDGATNILPIAPNRGDDLTAEQKAENSAVVRRAWKIHYDHCRHSLANGFYQGWDLHPAQLISRYAAVYAFFLESLDAASDRLCNFIEKAAQATLVGDVFDDAASGQGLLNYFLRAINCGAISEDDATKRTGLTVAEINSGSFLKILSNRK